MNLLFIFYEHLENLSSLLPIHNYPAPKLTCSGQPRPFVQDNGKRFPKLTLLDQNLLGQRGGVNPSSSSTPHLHPALARKSGVHPLPQGERNKKKTKNLNFPPAPLRKIQVYLDLSFAIPRFQETFLPIY